MAGESHDRRVIDVVGAHPGPHARGHEALIVLDDHAVLFGHQEPGRAVLPQGPAASVVRRRRRAKIGRWTAASTANSSAAAFCAKAAPKAVSGR